MEDLPGSMDGGDQPPTSPTSRTLPTSRTDRFERIYSEDLVYVADCWKLCGDAHCCNFTRYKSQFRLIGRASFHELHLLPGEYDFLAAKGWLDQFDPFEHKVLEFPIDDAVIKIESIISKRPQCLCEHDTRTTICRLYPRLPVFDVAGHLLGSEPMGIFEELEQIGRLTPACQVTSLPLAQMERFLRMTALLASDPSWLFYLEAYRLTKRHISTRLAERFADNDRSIFQVFEAAFIRNRLIDKESLRDELNVLAASFRTFYGNELRIA